MRSPISLSLAAAAVLLTACHSHGGYLSSDPELVYGPGVVEFPEAERVYLPMFRRAAAASSIGVRTAGVQLARASQPVQHLRVAAPPPARFLPGGHPPVAPTAPLPAGHPPVPPYSGGHAPSPGTHSVVVHDHTGPAPLPLPSRAYVNVQPGLGGVHVGVQPR